MLSNFLKISLTFFVFSIMFIGCQEDEYEIKYSVTSGIAGHSAKIIFIDAKNSDQILSNEDLPWNFSFNAQKGDSIKVSANVFDDGNIRIIGTDTLNVIIFINGMKYKENKGIIINSSSEIITVNGIIQ
jgi:hypothetical protein